MKNKLSSGKLVNVTLTADTASGAGVLVGALFGIAVTSGKAGDVIAIDTDGEFTLPATGAGSGQALAVGAVAYWDNTNKKVSADATGNTLIGHATAAKVTTGTEATIRIR